MAAGFGRRRISIEAQCSSSRYQPVAGGRDRRMTAWAFCDLSLGSRIALSLFDMSDHCRPDVEPGQRVNWLI